MLGGLLESLIDKEKAVYSKIQDTLVSVSEELGCSHKDFFLMIRPSNTEGDHKYYICGYDDNGNPKMVREILLKEIIN